jgi:hypothetical protein
VQFFERRPYYPWFVVTTVCIGAFMGQVDASIAQLAMPWFEMRSTRRWTREAGSPGNASCFGVASGHLTNETALSSISVEKHRRPDAAAVCMAGDEAGPERSVLGSHKSDCRRSRDRNTLPSLVKLRLHSRCRPRTMSARTSQSSSTTRTVRPLGEALTKRTPPAKWDGRSTQSKRDGDAW